MDDSSRDAARRRKKRDNEVRNKIKNMTKEALALAMSKKKECNARALQIVEQSIEPDVSEPWLLDNLKHINQSHFQDIVEERAITRICGYPLCIEKLTNVPKKMFKISTRENKVYDITDRKNYCSNNCYKAGAFLKDQLYTSPLWLRDCEKPVNYQTLSAQAGGKASGSGAEIDLGHTKPVKLDQKSSPDEETSSLRSPQVSESPPKIDSDFKHKTPHSTDISSQIASPNLNPESFKVLSDFKSEEIISSHNEPLGEVSNEKCPVKSLEPVRLEPKKAKRLKDNTKKTSSAFISEIEHKIESWFTLETMFYLLGKDKVRELLKLNGYSDEVPTKKDDYSFYVKCQDIYKKLNILELKEDTSDKEKPTKPVPDYDALKKESEELDLKVKSFYRGDGKVRFAEEEDWEGKESEVRDEEEPVLPLVDHCAVMATRRRIFMDRLNKVLPDMQSALELSHFRFGRELQELVSTFALGPKNITLKPPEWNLVTIILIKLLSLRNELLEYAYSRELTQTRLITYLLAYDLDGGYPDRFTSFLMDIERIASIYKK